MLERRETTYGHSYKLDGKAVKGVTTLLNAGYPKPMLVNWAAKAVAEYVADNFDLVRELRAQGRQETIDLLKGAHYRDRDRAAARGTDVHALAEELIHGQTVEVPEHLAGYVNGYVRFLDQWQITPVVTEKPCANRERWYAGTFDAVAEFGAGQLAGRRLLLDWKTSKGVYGETAMQLAAYQNAEFYVSNDGEEVPMPEVDGLAVVHVTPDGTDLYEIADPELAWKQFQHVAWVAMNADAIKKQIGDLTYFDAEAGAGNE
jgi:hypothetical protein